MNIVDVLKSEFTGFASEVLINNLPSIDGLLPVQRKVLWALHKNKVTPDKNYTKLLRAGAMTMVYYVFGDMPLYGAMKNMANNGLNNFYMNPKGSFGDKRRKNGVGASPRYIECKLDTYGNELLKGIDKGIIPIKRNYDNTEDEPIILPSPIPNILTNTSQSIAVGEASKIPAHNIGDVCNSIVCYLTEENINKAIDTLKCPDFTNIGGQIVYNKDTFKNIYNSGRGSFTLLGKYVYNEKENKISIVEVPYGTYIEDIERRLEASYDMGRFKEVTHIHNNTGKQGIQLDIYLKKNTDLKTFEKKLRKYTSYESKFSCNFTILDLDGKTPLLMSLKDIYDRWIQHRINCIKNETQYDIDKNNKELNRLLGLQMISNDLDNVIKIFRASKNEKIAMEQLKNIYNLNQEQLDYITIIRLPNINQEWISNKTNAIDNVKDEIETLTEFKNDNSKIKEEIIRQLNDIKKKFNKPRMTTIVGEDKVEEILAIDIIPDFNTKIVYTKQGYMKKLLKYSDTQKLKDNDEIIETIDTTNKSTLLLFTNKANRYRLPVHKLEETTPTKIGDFIPNLIDLEKDEYVIKIASVSDTKGNVICAYENGNVSKVPIEKFISNYEKIANCYNAKSKLVDIFYTKEDCDVLLATQSGHGLIMNTSCINPVASKNTKGVVGIKLDMENMENDKVIGVIFSCDKNTSFNLLTEKQKNIYTLLDDTGLNNNKSNYDYLAGNKNRNRMGNFIYNTRQKNDKIIEITVNK